MVWPPRGSTPRSAWSLTSTTTPSPKPSNGLYKTELIKPSGPWRTIDHVDVASLVWVHWFNHRRTSSYCADTPPAEYKATDYSQHRTYKITEFSNP